ncbi:conserved hypothetical protein [Trichinella spiralis]|uniref:hypothetical protein n=1 Tax=Trichinella spiralis TaxID=6334 RepID=UPI0001EFE440|nr:conserved hypothetical protein [Trichinella spiralis]
MANMIFPYQLILHDLHRYELAQHWPFVTTFHARLRQIASSPTCRYLPQLTNKRFEPTYPPSVHSLVTCSTFLLSSPCALRIGTHGEPHIPFVFSCSASCRPRSVSCRPRSVSCRPRSAQQGARVFAFFFLRCSYL